MNGWRKPTETEGATVAERLVVEVDGVVDVVLQLLGFKGRRVEAELVDWWVVEVLVVV